MGRAAAAASNGIAVLLSLSLSISFTLLPGLQDSDRPVKFKTRHYPLSLTDHHFRTLPFPYLYKTRVFITITNPLTNNSRGSRAYHIRDCAKFR
jgi:hypothetical protein